MWVSSKKCDTFSPDGRLAGLCEELGLIDLLTVDKRQDAGADTNECGVCVRRYTET